MRGNFRHGGSPAGRVSPEYRAWCNAKQRCNNPKDPRYHRYGGQGVRFHPAWENDFPAFLAHVGPRPGPGFSIDRKDNEGHYEPGNLRWATMSEQNKNRRPQVRHRVDMPNIPLT